MKNENVKLRASFVKLLGFKFECGDVVDSTLDHVTMPESLASLYNKKPEFNNDDITMISFAHRKNTGEQPCDGGLPVTCAFKSGKDGSCSAGVFTWNNDDTMNDIKSWMPDLDALIAMQVEHDKKQAIPEPATAEQLKEFDSLCDDKAIKPKQGDKVRIQYNHEMESEPYIHDAIYQFETDIEICVIDSDGHIMAIDKENFVAYHPLKSELDVLKEKQLKGIENDCINAQFTDPANLPLASLLEFMQEREWLREIIQPLAK